jgi:hypothetical protein
MRKILIVIAFLVELFSIARWHSCWLFQPNFYFTLPTLLARTIDTINLNKGMPVLLTHLMQNKIVYLILGGLQTLFEYWDIRFLKEFIGIVGAIGIIFALWYLITKFRRNILLWVLFMICLILSSIEMFFQPNVPYIWKLIAFGSAFQLFSLFGLWQFLKDKSNKRYFFIIIILFISILSFVLFPLGYQLFCLKV